MWVGVCGGGGGGGGGGGLVSWCARRNVDNPFLSVSFAPPTHTDTRARARSCALRLKFVITMIDVHAFMCAPMAFAPT